MAPFIPFVTDHVFHELGFEGSVHWENFPKPDLFLTQEEKKNILDRMSLVRNLAAAGHNLRTKGSVRVRQPLSNMTISGLNLLFEEECHLLKEELNLKDVTLSQNIVNATSFVAKANFRSLGKRCGKSMQNVAVAIANLSNQEILDLHNVSRNIFGFEITIDDVILTQTVQSQFPSETFDIFTVMLNTTLTPELIQEGDFREVCSFLQNLRKNNHLLLTDKITIYYYGPSNCFQNRLEELKNQVLAIDVVEKQLTPSNVLETSSGNITFEIQKV